MILEHMFPLRESRKNKQAFRERLQTVCPQVVLTWGRSGWQTARNVNDIANDTDKQSPKNLFLGKLFSTELSVKRQWCAYICRTVKSPNQWRHLHTFSRGEGSAAVQLTVNRGKSLVHVSAADTLCSGTMPTHNGGQAGHSSLFPL